MGRPQKQPRTSKKKNPSDDSSREGRSRPSRKPIGEASQLAPSPDRPQTGPSAAELIAEAKQRRLEADRAPVQRELETDYPGVPPSVWPGQLDAAERGLPFDPDIVATHTAGDVLWTHRITHRQTSEWLQTRIKNRRPARGPGAKGKLPGDLDPWNVLAVHDALIAEDPSRWNSKSAVAHLALEFGVGERTIYRCLDFARTNRMP